jgi:hypothetical protein
VLRDFHHFCERDDRHTEEANADESQLACGNCDFGVPGEKVVRGEAYRQEQAD